MAKEYKAPQSQGDGLQEKHDRQKNIRQAGRDGWIVSGHLLYEDENDESPWDGDGMGSSDCRDQDDMTAVIPKEATEIKPHAFASCVERKKVDIPEGVTKIGDDTFRDCRRLHREDIPERSQDKEPLTLEERLKYAAESRASSPEAAVRMVQKFSEIHAAYFFCGKEDLTAMNELTGQFWEDPSVEVDTYHGFSQTFRLAINYDTACRMRQAGTMLSAEDSCNPCQLIWSAGTVNAVILLGLMLLDHAKGRVKSKDIYHCMRMTLGQYLDALAEYISGKEGKPGSAQTNFRLFAQKFLKGHDGSAPLGEALAGILRRYIAARQEFGRLDHILRCMDALSCCLEEQGEIGEDPSQADSVRRFRKALGKYCPGLEGRKLMEEGVRHPDPYGHYLALAKEYPEDVPDPGSEGLALRAVRSQVFLPGYGYSPETLRGLAVQIPFRDFRELLEKNICEEQMVRAMGEINTSAVYLYMLWVKPYLPAERYRLG